MTHFVIRDSRAALAGTALTAVLSLAVLMTWAASAGAQQVALHDSKSSSRLVAANDAPAGSAAPSATLGAPGAALGGPGTGMAPKSEAAPPTPGAAPVKPGSKAAAAISTEPTQAEINEALLYAHQPPTRVRIAIVNATGNPNGAAKVAVLLSEYRRLPLEDKMGLKIDVTNISTGYDRTQAPAVVYYRPGFLRAALLLAQAIPGDTMVSAMRPQALKRAGMDVEVVVGEALP